MIKEATEQIVAEKYLEKIQVEYREIEEYCKVLQRVRRYEM